MLIEKIALLNFRNYPTLALEMDPRLNLFIGDNAQGKTNILEAIYYSGTFRSHRTNKDMDLVKWNEQYAIIKVWGQNLLGKFTLEIALNSAGKKRFKVNGVEKKKVGEIIGTVKTVLFSPEDLSLVKGSPVIRRKFLDNEISQLSPSYYYNLLNYHKVLGHRNTILKEIRNKKSQIENLDVWDQQIAAYGTKIITKRLEVLKKLNPLARLMHRKITNGREELEMKYVSNTGAYEGIQSDEVEKVFFTQLVSKRSEDIDKGITLLGPHRDDLIFFINNKDIKSFGSQGQQRTASLSTKLAEIELVKGETGEYPVLLLDDVMSELDVDRRKYLLETVQTRIQTFITATDNNFMEEEAQKDWSVFIVNQGKIL